MQLSPTGEQPHPKKIHYSSVCASACVAAKPVILAIELLIDLMAVSCHACDLGVDARGVAHQHDILKTFPYWQPVASRQSLSVRMCREPAVQLVCMQHL